MQTKTSDIRSEMALLVSNTSPLIAFSAIDRLDLVRGIFSDVLIPPGVRRELFPDREWENARAVQRVIGEHSWIRIQQPPTPENWRPELRKLGMGEAEAIAISLEQKLPVLLDDLRARRVAQSLGVEIVGSLGILARNRQMIAIPAVKPIVEAIHRAGIYYDPALISRFLGALGEL